MARVVAVTGGTGFIGRHLVARHVEQGDTVRYLTRSGAAPRLPGADPHLGDLSLPDTLVDFVCGADVLYHCAAELNVASRMELTNLVGTANLIKVAVGKVGRWVQLSSTGIYGPVRNGVVREISSVCPGNPYEKSKAAADDLLLDEATRRGMECVLLRPSNVYGADMPNQSIFQLIRMIDSGLFFYIGSPGAMMNYVHVENVVDALLLCANAEQTKSGVPYIVSDNLPLEDFVRIISASLGKRVPRGRLPEFPIRMLAMACDVIPGCPLKSSRVDALTTRVIYSTDRIVSELGYRNGVSLEAGLNELVMSYRHASH